MLREMVKVGTCRISQRICESCLHAESSSDHVLRAFSVERNHVRYRLRAEGAQVSDSSADMISTVDILEQS